MKIKWKNVIASFRISPKRSQPCCLVYILKIDYKSDFNMIYTNNVCVITVLDASLRFLAYDMYIKCITLPKEKA